MKPFFKPHDFVTAMTTDEYVPDHVADIANEKLNELSDIINIILKIEGVNDCDKLDMIKLLANYK